MTELSRNFGTSRLINRFDREPYAFAFSGQGFDWLKTLRAAVAAGAGTNVQGIVERAQELLAPVADELAGTFPFGFDPVGWANAVDAPNFDTAQAAVSVPGIFVSQIATLDSLESQRLDVEKSVAAIGHSQGVLGVHLLNDLTRADEYVALAQLIGAAITRAGRMTGLIAQGTRSPMVAIAGITREQLQSAIDQTCAEVPEEIRPVIGLRNARTVYVLVGRPDDNQRVITALEAMAAADAKALEKKQRGGQPFTPRITELDVQAAFHHPAMALAVEQTVTWAGACGLDGAIAREVAADVLVNPVDWVSSVNTALDAGARWILDVGPDGGVVSLTNSILAGRGAESFAVCDSTGQAQVFDAGLAPELPRSYDEFAPRVESINGQPRLVTRFTELTGRSPMLLAGMTPTTVDPEIVAAAANGGHWAELAGGGQVTPEILERNIDKLTELLEPGVNAQFNSMFLDPYLWKMQIGGKRLVPKARANGAPIDGIVITAGMPEKDEAVSLVRELIHGGFPWISFKPGAVKQVRAVLAVARELPDAPIIMHLEGGIAGGHHSWEDLDDLLITTYAEIRALDNVVLCVGGGIGTPERAADYITGSWAQAHGLPDMPVDGILIGTAAMAAKEATTSQSVKELLVATKGSTAWVPAGGSANGMASGRSQLGADIHEIDNSFARAGRLLDEVAGDGTAVQARREEIIAAMAKTAKVYFGDIESMTYQDWLNRYLELSGPVNGEWIDASWANRFSQMLERAEARLIEQDHGQFVPSYTLDGAVAPQQVVDKLVADLPQAATDLLTPSDAAWFLGLCRTPGKPVCFVPVIDKDVRRWWRSDSLWQSHDERFDADQVAIIPGPAAVGGITEANEPVADLLDRFNAASIERISEVVEVERDLIAELLTAPGTYWAGRNTISMVHRLGDVDAWERTGDTATHAPTGARLDLEDTEHVLLTVPLAGSTAFGTTTDLVMRFTLPADAIAGSVPQVTQADAEAAMGELTRVAAGGTLASVDNNVATWDTTLDAGHLADYDNVTASYLPSTVAPATTAPDVLVGRAWPAVFAAVRSAIIPGTDSASVVEGMLSLVHLEHHIVLTSDLPSVADGEVALHVTATADEVSDTAMGRVVVVRAQIFSGDTKIATLAERFAIRGRNGNTVARTNTSSLPTTIDTPRSHRAVAKVVAPESMRPFAVVSGDRNPIHVSDTAASLAGLPGVIVHGMWTSAIGELIAGASFNDDQTHTPAAKIVEYTATMLAPVLPGETIEFTVERSAVDSRPGHGEVRSVTATVDGNLVLTATAVVAAPTTFYAFPGQGIQSQGMGMDSRRTSAAARAIWDRADKHTRTRLGFSILEIVENNPSEVTVDGEKFFHPDGVLFLTQFTQVGMATLGVAQVAEMREANALNQRAFFAGHSVGEYNALAAYAGVLSLESVVEIVYRRGLTMHRLVERDENGLSNYGLAALRPNKMGLTADDVFDYVAAVSERSGEFLEIVNYNLAGLQYAVAGTQAGLAALSADVEARAPRQRAFIMIPGIDVPFHSSKLRDGVGAFREHLDSLIPAELGLDTLLGRYIPNLVARPFELTRDFVEAMADVVDSSYVNDILSDFPAAAQDKQKLARTLLIELLAWQFASPVRWIETQDLLIRSQAHGGLGVERFVEVGVGSAPTVANMMGQTLNLPQYREADIEVLNIERDRPVVFATDEIVRAVEETDSDTTAVPEVAEAPAGVPANAPAPVALATGGPRPDDIQFTPSDATEMLIAIWTKVRPDQMGATDSIETLVEGVSSRRNQLLLDLGVEFGLGAIDGAADAELGDLKVTVSKMAKGYKAFGPVLSDSAADALRRITGPTGKRPAYIADRVTGTWQLGQGWADHVVAEVVIAAREGASLRGGELATLSPATPTNVAELDALIDAAVQAVATRTGVAVSLPSAGGTGGGVVDSAALGEFAEQVTGKAGVLAATARTILSQLGLDAPVQAALEETDSDNQLYDLVSRELGSDWPRQVAPSFDVDKVVQLDDRWASAREDLTRVALGELAAADIDVTGAGDAVAAQAEFFGLDALAEQARDTAALDYADDVAVVTGGSPNSIAAAVVEKLLAGGATVVATTSSLNPSRLEFYKELYARSARGTAALWVVPANLSSYADIDAIVEWVGSAQTATVNGASKLVKPALVPTLLFPFAAPRVSGSMADAGGQTEAQMRLLLWSVERLIVGLAPLGSNTRVGHRLHVVIPGSPNRGRFGGDGAYGESKAALDAVVTRWNAEQNAWAAHTSLVHAHIGWVRGTGLMGGNDPLVAAAEEAGVETYSASEIADKLISQVSGQVRKSAAQAPITVDFTGGLGESDINLAEMARALEQTPAEETEKPHTIAALPTPYRPVIQTTPDFSAQVSQSLADMVVIVGAGELGPLGSARTRFDAELSGDLSAAGVIELAWTMGLIHWDTDPTPGWYDESDDVIAEEDIYDRFHDEVMGRVGVRRYNDMAAYGMFDNFAPELTTVYLDHDLTFSVGSREEAQTYVDSEPALTIAAYDVQNEEWKVTRKSGSAIRVPRRMAMTRFVGGQVPKDFDPAVWGIPADMVDNLDTVAQWNIVCTVDAFLSAGFTPAELLASVHPARVSSTQGTGMGGMESLRGIYVDRILAEPRANDVLQEALPNVVAAHVMQSYVGGYGQMIHPVAACATAAVSVEEGLDKIRLGKADFVVTGGFDALSVEGITGFGDMAATADSAEMEGKGIEHRFFSRANDRRRGGFIESEGGGTILLARASLAADMGLPVLGVVGFAESFADGAHTSIPAPGLGALGAARDGVNSRLAQALREVGVTADEISIISKHDTSTNANDPNESDLHERIAAAIGRTPGNPLYVISQKTLTGHAKGGAAAFQLIGLTQVLRSGQVPANRALDCVDPVLAKHKHLVWLRKPLDLSEKAPKAGLITSLGFGHVSAMVAIVHPEAFYEAVRVERGEAAADQWRAAAAAREEAGLRRIVAGMHGGVLYERPVERNLGVHGDAAKEVEAAVLLDSRARLVRGVLNPEGAQG